MKFKLWKIHSQISQTNKRGKIIMWFCVRHGDTGKKKDESFELEKRERK
jgi:hypothetical protein